MVSAEQLVEQIRECAEGRLSLNDFEEWFSANSRNVQLWGDDEVKRFVFDIEDVFSRHYFENVGEPVVVSALQEVSQEFARPFAQSADGMNVCEFRVDDVSRRPQVLWNRPIVGLAAAILVAMPALQVIASDEPASPLVIIVADIPSMGTASTTESVPVLVAVVEAVV